MFADIAGLQHEVVRVFNKSSDSFELSTHLRQNCSAVVYSVETVTVTAMLP
jgi:hypothetical protein